MMTPANEDSDEEAKRAEALTRELMDRGLTVCFSDGGIGLVNSKACCILLSRASINNESDVTRNLASVDNETTEIDDFFVDIRMAIELTHHGLLEGGVHAVLVGDKVVSRAAEEETALEEKSASITTEGAAAPGGEVFAPYFATHDDEDLGKWGGSHPLRLCDEAIDLVERKICNLLQSFCLGACPILNEGEASVSAILRKLVACNNILVIGPVEEAWRAAADQVCEDIGSAASNQQGEAGDGGALAGAGAGAGEGDPKSRAAIALLMEKVHNKERELELLSTTLDKERQNLDSSKKRLAALRYKYSIFE
jgi:hypothetical protein